MSRHQLRRGLMLKFLWRDWRGGELNILLVSLVLAVATVTSIALFTSRIQNAIYQEASNFLAADAKVSGSTPIDEAWKREGSTAKIKSADITSFRSMAFAQDNMVLTQVKAVSDAYPLRGELMISDAPYDASRPSSSGPRPGEAWIAPRLFDVLALAPGGTIAIGNAEFKVTASLNQEPDSGQSLFGFAPRVMIHHADVAKTGAIQTGSRAEYSWLLAAPAQTIENFRTSLEPQLGNHHRWVGVKSGNRGVGDALARAERFLLLTGCLSVILSGVAISLAARRYAKRQASQVALLKTLGTPPSNILRLYSSNILLIGLIAIAIGAALGWTLHWGILVALGKLLPSDLAAPSWSAYSTGAVTGFVALWAFAAPPFIALRSIPPANILRDNADQHLSTVVTTVIGFFAIIGLMYFYSRDLVITATLAGAAALCVLGVGILSNILLVALKPIGDKIGHSWRLGLANLKRHRRFNLMQIVIFSILLMLMFILIGVRTGLINQWKAQLPDDAPNHFVFNIFPDETPAIQNYFDSNGISASAFYPMTRGRVLQVNDELSADLAADASNRINYERELNLTWSDSYGEDNAIEQGRWWEGDQSAEDLVVSVEKEYAEGIGITLDDTLTFSIAGQTVTARVSNIRSVQWDSMNPNFFVIFNREIINGVGANWITSFHLSEQDKPRLNKLSRQFPTISIVELDQTMNQIQSIIGKVSLAIEFILVLVLASGVLVLITSIQATLDVRVQESAIFRTLGANRSLVRRTLLVEFCTLGAMAGVLGVVGAEVCNYFLQTQVFNLSYTPQLIIAAAGPILGAVVIGITGWLSTRKVIDTPPLHVLRAT